MFALAGRAKETAELNNVLVAVRDGLGGALVLRGEAGIGKSALLNWAAWSASDMRVIRVAGAESEADLGFAGLHQLLLPFLGELDRLPDPQRVALGSALGLIAGEPANQFLVGLAALTLITGAAASQPVLCVVDDAQWLDGGSAEVLGFVARRLLADRVGMLFAVEDEAGQLAAFSGLPELAVGGLSGEESRELLAASAAGSVHPMVAMRIVAETAGNPLALVEFGGELTAGELSGAVPLIGPLRSGRRLAELYLSRVRALPADAQTLLLVVAADQLGDPAKVWRAASQLGISAATAELPSVEQLVTWVPAARFRHSLMRSAV